MINSAAALRYVYHNNFGGVSVWIIDTQNSGLTSEHLQYLSEKEIRRQNKFHFLERRIQFAVAHTATRIFVARKFGGHPADVHFENSPNGQPIISNLKDVVLSLSYSANWIAICIALKTMVGVDIEINSTSIIPLEYAKYAFTTIELNALQSLSPSDMRSAFLRLWTAKEAILKATGLGIPRHLQDFSLVFCDDEYKLKNVAPSLTNLFSDFSLKRLRLPIACECTLAVKTTGAH